MRRLAILATTLLLQAQPTKPPAPAVAWSYETPRGFHLLEPAYRFPTQIKQALVLFVQPVPALSREYQAVFLDKRKFSVWLKGVLIDYRTRRTKAVKSEGNVLSSDVSKLSLEGGTILSTTRVQPRKATDLDEVERYLDVLQLWSPD